MADSSSLISALVQLQNQPTKGERFGQAVTQVAGGIQPTSAFGALAKGIAQGYGLNKQLEGQEERSSRTEGLQKLLQEELTRAQALEANAASLKKFELLSKVKADNQAEIDEIIGRISRLPRDQQSAALKQALANNSTMQALATAGLPDGISPAGLNVALEEGTNKFIFTDPSTGQTAVSPIDFFMSNDARASLQKQLSESPEGKIEAFQKISSMEGISPEVAASAAGLGKIQTSGESLSKSVEGRAKFAGLEQSKASLAVMKQLVFDKDGTLNQSNLAASAASFIPFLDEVVGTEGRSLEAASLSTINSLFRTESGAAVPEPEVKRYLKMFVPSFGDNAQTAHFKIKNLEQRLTVMAERIQGIDPSMTEEQRKEELTRIFREDAAVATKEQAEIIAKRERFENFVETASKLEDPLTKKPYTKQKVYELLKQKFGKSQ